MDELKGILCENLTIGENGHLFFAGQDTADLAKRYGTPVYLMDEGLIRRRCRTYMQAASTAFNGRARILYASKAASFKQLYRIMKEEGMYVDVVSPGEIYTAKQAGFPLEKAYFHSNNKTDWDIAYAMDNKVGYFVIDTEEELLAINAEAGRRGIRQPVLLRITPGIDPHTYEAVSTGKVDSKFGFAIKTGQAEEITRLALAQPNLEVAGYHCHVGSQMFDSYVYVRSANVMFDFIADMKAKTGYEPDQLNLGGGYGVRYVTSDPVIDIAGSLIEVGQYVAQKAASVGVKVPLICFEPGRSIVADAGLTLYTVGSVKKIPGYKNYVSVDGGMTDNIRFALYGAAYTVVPAEDMNALRDMICSVVGRCCESDDVIQNGILLPSTLKRGDLLACLTTGAYHYSMASNYNRIPRLPVVMLTEDGGSYVAVQRETLEDLVRLDT